MVFLFILLTIIVFVIILFYAKIRMEVTNFRFCSQTKRHINQDYKIVIKLCIFGYLPILKITLTKQRLEKMKLKERIKNIDFSILEKSPSFDRKIGRVIKAFDILIKSIDFHIEIGTENASLTSFIVPAISTVIAIGLRKKMKTFKNQIFTVKPIYQNQNMVNLSISGIFELKMRHIINIIYIFSKKGVKEYERTSNRRSYDYSYE